MNGFWLKFTDGSEGYCEGENDYDAKRIAEHFTKKKVAGGEYRDIAAKSLPYPANPLIWQFDHPLNGKCPPFCSTPKNNARGARHAPNLMRVANDHFRPSGRDPMSDTPATPTPWYVPLNQRAIYSESGNVVLSASASAKCGRAGDYYQCGDATGALHLTLKPEDLAFIVLAVNSHATLTSQRDALVKALNRLLYSIDICNSQNANNISQEQYTGMRDHYNTTLAEARAALKLAETQP